MTKQERVYIPLPLYHLEQIQYWLAVGICVLGVEKFSGGGYHWEVYLPVGWKCGGRSQRFIFDKKGRTRVFINYDGRAEEPTSNFLTRYDHTHWWLKECGKHIVFDRIDMGDLHPPLEEYKIIHTIDGIPSGGKVELYNEQCIQWLSKNYPDWQNPLAYWDE